MGAFSAEFEDGLGANLQKKTSNTLDKELRQTGEKKNLNVLILAKVSVYRICSVVGAQIPWE